MGTLVRVLDALGLLAEMDQLLAPQRDPATWLGNAAVHVAQQWKSQLRDLNVPAAHTAHQFAPAFALATEWADAPERLDEALTTIEHSRRKGRRYRQTG